MKKYRRYVRVVAGILAGFLLAGCGPQDDVRFARGVLNGLIRGRFSVRHAIDWPSFKALEYDVGKEYALYKTNEERTDYERSFIENFAINYKRSGATAKAFFGWCVVQASDPNLTIVGAYCHDKSTLFLFYVKRQGWRKKLAEMKLMRPLEAK